MRQEQVLEKERGQVGAAAKAPLAAHTVTSLLGELDPVAGAEGVIA
jgi:hypothetical protein